VHELVRTDDRVDRAGITAVVATDARSLVNNGNRWYDALGQRYGLFAEESCQSANRVITAGRAQVDCGRTLDNGGRIRPAAWITALGALRLRQQVIDLLHEVAIGWRQATGGKAQCKARDERY
jgi:hypothetical protein